MRKIAFVFIAMFFASLARAQTGTISLSVTATPSAITVNQNCNYVVIEENSASPSNSYTITPAGQSTGIVYPAGARFVFSAGANGFKSGQTIGTIAVSGGTVAFVGIESTATPTVPSSASNGGGNGNVGGSSGQVQYNNSGTFGGIGGSSVTSATGAVTLTAGLDTTTPWSIASHSSTQSASLLDLNNQSTGSRTAILAVHGRGMGSYTPSALTAVMNVEQQSVATAAYGLTLTNRQAGGSGGALSILTAGESDGGIGSWCGGNTVGDGNGNFLCISFDSTKGVLIQPNSVSPSTTAGLVPLTVQALASGQTADLLDIKNSGGSVLAFFDKSGNLTAPNTPQEICTGQVALSTGAINSGTRATNTLSCSGLSASTDSISCTFSGDTNAVTGYAPSASGGLTLKTWVSANTVNVDQVNDTGGSITPGAATVNCKGIR